MLSDLSNRNLAAPRLLRALSIAVCERKGELRTARHTLKTERSEVELLQVSGGEVDEALRRAIEGLRDAVMSLGGRGAVIALRLSGPIPHDPDALLRMALELVGVLRGPMPDALRVSGRALDAWCAADRIQALARRMELERQALAEQRARVDQARQAYGGARARYESEMASAVAVLVGMGDFSPGSSGALQPGRRL